MVIRQRITYFRSTDLPYIIILLICCIVAYWPVSFFVYSLKNDALNYFLPVRFQVSEAINNGHWPFWSPYFNLGYPLHGDMQSGAWNPIVQLLSLFGPYTLRTLHYETLLYVFLSGLGMFYLIKHFKIDKGICLLVGASYMLCGYNSDSAQFLNWISAASFLPFVILFSMRSFNEHSWKASVLSGLFIYLFFVTAYPADFVILFYLLVVFFIWQVAQKRENQKQKNLLTLMKQLLITTVVFVLLSLPAILSYVQFLPLTERGSGTSYESAMTNPFHPLLFFSYVTPLPVWKASFASVTDPLERNSYFGLIVVVFLIAGFSLKARSKWLNFCKWGFIISALFSLGEIGGLRVITYHFLPLMNSFRHPANAKIFTIFFGCNIAAISMQYFRFGPNKKRLIYSSAFIFSILVLLFIWSLKGGNKLFNQVIVLDGISDSGQIKNFIDRLSFSDLLLLNIIIQLPFLLTIYLFAIKKINFKIIVYAGIINVVLHTILFTPFTVVKNTRADYIQNLININVVKNYTADLNSSIQKNSKEGDRLFKEIGVLNMYNKKIGRIDYRITPSNLNSQNIFWNENKRLRDIFTNYPILYKADTVMSIKDSAKVYSLKEKKVILVNDINKFKRTGFQSKHYSITVKKFTPNQWDLIIRNEEPGIFCLFQNYYPNWKLYVDGKPEAIIESNGSFMGFRLEEGSHHISFHYKPTAIKIAFLISVLFLICILLFISDIFAPRRSKKSGKN